LLRNLPQNSDGSRVGTEMQLDVLDLRLEVVVAAAAERAVVCAPVVACRIYAPAVCADEHRSEKRPSKQPCVVDQPNDGAAA
jgi:hypothetical protein